MTQSRAGRSADAQVAPRLDSIDEVQSVLAAQRYIADRGLATAVYLALKRHKPLLLEGEPGVGKTEVARVLADMLGAQLIRCSATRASTSPPPSMSGTMRASCCYIRSLEAQNGKARAAPAHGAMSSGRSFSSGARCSRRSTPPHERAPVLLIDELDRADAEFEAYLLELLSDYQITIPEIGTLRAAQPPIVILTSNRTRDIHDALRRRCLYYWIEYPYAGKRVRHRARARARGAGRLARQVVAFVQALRGEDLYKAPGVAETLDWLAALVTLGQTELTEASRARRAWRAAQVSGRHRRRSTNGDLLAQAGGEDARHRRWRGKDISMSEPRDRDGAESAAATSH